MEPESRIADTSTNRSLKREEQVAVWVSVGVVFLSLLITSMLGMVVGSEEEIAETPAPAVTEQQAEGEEGEEADSAVSCAIRPAGLVCWALRQPWFSA